MSFIRDGLEERKARLVSSVAVIKIGGDSMLDVNERKIEEAAQRCSGAFVLFILSKCSSPSQAQGIAIIKKALETPCYTIAFNAGVDATSVVAKVLSAEGNIGYDAMSDTFVDMLAEGIIDPTKVVRIALTDAAGVASLLTAAEVVITNLRETKADKDPPGDQGEVDDYDSGNISLKSRSRYHS
ncbi:hypothetical protein GE061_009613 [Apolygus lucorum]|uniref:Uncharacterized protein n=1 Tax=Apolygus lucorum TaxID=248454 RepID=A0A8S9Y287_APOLU|nr:hypothetical protein GE061_009613 [Apolygus lucorum]